MQSPYLYKNGDYSRYLEFDILRNDQAMGNSSLEEKNVKRFQKSSRLTKKAITPSIFEILSKTL